MRCLLDTHAFLWWVLNDARLSSPAREVLRDAESEVFFSSASAWEIAIKARLGRSDIFEIDGNPEELIPERIAANGFRVLPVDLRHALHVAALPPLHGDPFDRLLVVQAQLEHLTLLTGDLAIARYGVPVIW